MKKIFLSIMLVAIGQMSMAQVVQENEAAVVYYMPKNELVITLAYDIVKQEPGIFYQYAGRYLGTEDVITEDKTSYVLRGVRSEISTIADMDRAYKVSAAQGIKEQMLTLSADGRLLGYNIGLEDAAEPLPFSGRPTGYCSEDRGAEELMPLLEEQFMASSTAKMAEGAAKLIYRIREARLNLLAGEVEHVPADGEAMKQVLAELDEQEQSLVALFIGKTVVRHASYCVTYTPSESVQNETLCRFSVHSGVVAADDLSGEPLYISLEATKQTLGIAVESNSKSPLLSQLYYNIPGEAKVSVTYKSKEMVSEKYQIAQFGVAIPMAKQWFTVKQAPVIHINPMTGNILSIKN